MNIVVAVARDEHLYLDEWVAHHREQGFDRIVIYDDRSDPPLTAPPGAEVLAGPNPFDAQLVNYHRALQEFADAEWIAFIDVDEFIVSPRPLREALNVASDIGSLFANWRVFNANGLEHYDARPVMQRFTRTCSPRDWFPFGKSIVRPMAVQQMERHTPSLMRPGWRTEMTDIRVNHYYTKSYEEWLLKVRRGWCGTLQKPAWDFFQYNPDMLHLLKGSANGLPVSSDTDSR